MNAIAQFVRTTIVGGLLFLAPIVVLIVILAKAFDYAKNGLNAVLVYFQAAYELNAGRRQRSVIASTTARTRPAKPIDLKPPQSAQEARDAIARITAIDRQG
jgi:hypothetical protein